MRSSRIPILAVVGGALCASACHHEPAKDAPAPAVVHGTPATEPTAMNTPSANLQTAMFGAGCFWGVEARFRKIPGVVDTAVGYSGGTTDKPTYKDVCTDRTGHAEVVRVTFDPSKVSYATLVDFFFEHHDPTQVNRQGPDYGTQYRSVIFYFDPEQQKVAQAIKARLTESHTFARPVATQIVPAAPFWMAEDYHQRYLEKNGLDSCATGG